MVKSAARVWFEKNAGIGGCEVFRQCAKATGLHIDTVRRVYKQMNATQKTTKAASGISEADLRARHDLLYQLREGVKRLQDGIYPLESEFVSDYCKISRGGFKHMLEMPEFSDYRGRAGAKTYWGTKKSIARLRADNVLQ